MLEEAEIVSRLFLDDWEKLLSQDVLVRFFIPGFFIPVLWAHGEGARSRG